MNKTMEIEATEVPSTGLDMYLYEITIDEEEEEVYWYEARANDPELGFATVCHFMRDQAIFGKINCKTYHAVGAKL